MDVYALTRKNRPSQLTLGQPSRLSGTTNVAAADGGSMGKADTMTSHRSSVSSMSSSLSYKVTGPPSRDHWKPDADSVKCAYPGCQASFGLFERRHHCRKCGDIYCSIHCSNYFRLDQFSQFHPQGHLSRGCNTCASECHTWHSEQRQMEKENTHQQGQQGEEHNRRLRTRRHAGIMTQQPQAMEGVTELGREDIVQPANEQVSATKDIAIKTSLKHDQGEFNPIPSVPADWQWSTF